MFQDPNLWTEGGLLRETTSQWFGHGRPPEDSHEECRLGVSWGPVGHFFLGRLGCTGRGRVLEVEDGVVRPYRR